jgi:hypothetical protein
MEVNKESQVGTPEEVPVGEPYPVTILLQPGTASPEEIAELFLAISDLYRSLGGSGLKWTVLTAPRK